MRALARIGSRAAVPAEKFANAVADKAGAEYRAFKYNADLNCVLMQQGLTVLVLPAFAQPDGTIFIDKELGFSALRQALGTEKMKLIKEAFTS